MNVFELFATLGIDTSKYDEGLSGAESKGSSFAKNLGSVVATGAKVATAAIGAVTGATVAGTVAFVNGVSSVASYGDQIEKTAQKLGVSNEAYQEWDYVMNIAGTSMQNMQMGVKTLTNQLDEAVNGSEDAQAKFAALGLSLEDLQNMSREEVFEAAIYGFQGMADSTERAALANDLFGRSGQELTPLFNMTQEQTQELIETANEYGMVMSDDAVEASATFQDSLTTLQGTMNGLKNNMLAEFLPSFSTVMDGLSAVFAGDEGGLAMIDEGVNDFIEKLNEIAPKALEIGASILSSLIEAISSNLPSLLSQGGDVLNSLIQGIISALPSLLESAVLIIKMIASSLIDNADLLLSTAVDLLLMLANGLTESLPTMIPSIVGIITEMISVLTSPENLELFIETGLNLILAIADGLVAATPDLLGIIPEVMANIIVTMEEEYPNILSTVLELLGDLGLALLEGLAALMGTSFEDVAGGLSLIKEEISNAFENIKQWFQDLWDNLTEKVSSLWSDITGFFSEGLANAKETVESVLGTISETFSSIFDTVKETVSGAIDYVKGLFDFEWSLPDLKLPHFSITGSLDLMANPPSVPKLSVDWYAKAYSDAYILNGATIFGSQGSSLLGGGEGAGSEVVVGTNKLVSMMADAVREAGYGQTIVIPVYIGDEKIDEVIVKANRRNDYISGGR